MNRRTGILYIDGALGGGGQWTPTGPDNRPLFKGIGGVLFTPNSSRAHYFSDALSPKRSGFDHIAGIELYAIIVALRTWADKLRGPALILFCDSKRAIGCLLRRSSSVVEQHVSECKLNPGIFKIDSRVSNNRLEFSQSDLEHPSDTLREHMNLYTLRIWRLVQELGILLWVEYVHTKSNTADAPSRDEPPPDVSPYKFVNVTEPAPNSATDISLYQF